MGCALARAGTGRTLARAGRELQRAQPRKRPEAEECHDDDNKLQ